MLFLLGPWVFGLVWWDWAFSVGTARKDGA